jgi:CelD/BcsL family acetyltransferase involved in cellulose biosynthesis
MAVTRARPDPAVSATVPPAAPQDAEALTVAVIEDVEGFLALREEWDALFARAALPQQVFQSHVVLRHWARHYLDSGSRRIGTESSKCEKRDLHHRVRAWLLRKTGSHFFAPCSSSRLSIVTLRRGGVLAMIWPLVRERRLGIDTLRFMGIPIAQFGDVLVERDGREALLQAGWQALRRLGADIFEARKLRADSILAESGLLAGAVVLERLDAPFADLNARVGRDGPSAIYPARERSNHRRRLRRLGERGPIGFAMEGPGPEAAALAGQAVAMKQVALRRHGIIAPTIADPRFSAFFRDFAGDAAGGSPLRVALIGCAGLPIGIDLSLDCKGTSFGHVIATHPDHERGGVGGILIHHSFASARQRGSAIFDLLAPADAYKLEHADGATAVRDLALPLSLKGRLVCGLGLQRLRPALKTALKRLPAPLARRIAAWAPGGKG